jgi:alkylphenol/PAH-inducible cytochrome P450 monooxygenase
MRDMFSLPEVWGEDADEWNPMRHLEGRVNTEIRVGMFGNL